MVLRSWALTDFFASGAMDSSSLERRKRVRILSLALSFRSLSSTSNWHLIPRAESVVKLWIFSLGFAGATGDSKSRHKTEQRAHFHSMPPSYHELRLLSGYGRSFP